MNRDRSDQVYKWLIQAHRARAQAILRDRAATLSGEMRILGSEISEGLTSAAETVAEGLLRRSSRLLRRVRDDDVGADAESSLLGRLGSVEEGRAKLPEHFRPESTSERVGASRVESLERPETIFSEASDVSAASVLPEEPWELNQLWSTLSRDDKLTLWSDEPTIGNRDGIPQRDRDILNRLHLEEMRKTAEQSNDTEALDICNRITNAIGPEGDHYLLYLDKDFNTVVSDADMDTAKYKMTYVVGAGSAPLKASSVGVTDTLSQAARRMSADPDATVATARWQAYRRPDGGVEVRSASFAENAAPKLRRFQEGLLVTHQGESAPLSTMVGHSYGTRVIGEAARADAVGPEGLYADQLVFTGSVGTGVDHVTDFKLAGVDRIDNGKRVYATIKKYDPARLWTNEHGPKPTDPAFNATVFSIPSERGPISRLGFNSQEHWDYYYEGDSNSTNELLDKIGLIATGRGHLVNA